MGTNYYVRKNVCTECNRYEEQHIGKSSYGWKFYFNPYKQSYKEWIEYLAKFEIYNEYGDKIPLKEFTALVESKQKCKGAYGDDAPDEHEYADEEGYSISKYKEFS